MDSLISKTALAKLAKIIEFVDIILENDQSFIVVCSEDIVFEAVRAAMEKRKVANIDLGMIYKKEVRKRL